MKFRLFRASGTRSSSLEESAGNETGLGLDEL